MANKVPTVGAFGGAHTAGIYSDMTVDGPVIGTLVVIMDRAKNLPNRRTMGKQDPYVAARLGKQAEKTKTDKRGGQTPRWDQELRFTVRDSADYHSLKVSVFNDDKKTELIGETWVNLDDVLNPGGGQSDSWHSLNCKGKYAGEIRIELTYYDTRPKPEKMVEKRRKSVGAGEVQSPSVSGPREGTAVKRRPLPSDPTGTSPSPIHTPRTQPRVSGAQSGPRGHPTTPRHHGQDRSQEQTPSHRRRSHNPEQSHSADRRRPVPNASPNAMQPPHHPSSAEYAPQSYSQSQYNDNGVDFSYAAPKPYEVKPIEPLPQHPADAGHLTSSHRDYRSSYAELPHSHSAPVVPTHQPYGHEVVRQDPYSAVPHEQPRQFHHSPDPYDEPYDEPSQQVAPLRLHQSRSRDDGWRANQLQASTSYPELQNQHTPYTAQGRPNSAMQPTVEDEDNDIPPPPPVHRKNAATIPQLIPEPHYQPPSYQGDAPAPLSFSRSRGEQFHAGYDEPLQPYQAASEYHELPSDRRYTHPQPSTSRPVSRDIMVPSPLRQGTIALPTSLIPGYNPQAFDQAEHPEQDNQMSLVPTNRRGSQLYQTSPVYEPHDHQRQLSEPSYQDPPQYEAATAQYQNEQALVYTGTSSYYPHSAPQEPRARSPFQDPAPLIKPRPVSPVETRRSMDNRTSRFPARSTPTRKSVSPRPPPSRDDPGERRLSGVAFSPDDFNVLNPRMSHTSLSGQNSDAKDGLERRNSHVEINDKGQVVTFSGRVIDASDHLPVDSWAPEPEPKGTIKERPVRERIGLNGARDISDVEAARQRERERKERDRIRNAVNATAGVSGSPSSALVSSRRQSSPLYGSNGSPSSALVTARHQYTTSLPRATEPDNYDSSSPGSRNRPQKHDRRPVSSSHTPGESPPYGTSPNRNVLRERSKIGGYGGGSPGYASRPSAPAPPIPAKVPISPGEGIPSEDMALCLELQNIDIGPGSGTRSRRRYGGY
ncbi:hypothetical protein GQ43DRAFT_56387 [Delitschia confertaspora ATCC 74209]|uniref:C2 domain-containing protein n=1 Tax=Delitschia confertaspora ATCC 74209 TaxID=1513339 RepID=A0A9P4JQR5_9PLEO|nr:hypothetical protein GQ43DRAFT_56387 [Delitschia confertaspora ATCC 74209]